MTTSGSHVSNRRIMNGERGDVAVSMTTSKYTVGNIVAVIVCMLFAVGVALYAFFGNPSRGTPGVMGVALEVSTSTVCRSVLTPPGPGGHPSVGGS